MRYKLSIYLPLMLFVALLLSVAGIKEIKVYAYSTDQAAIDAAVNYTHGYNYYVVIKQYSLDKAQFGHVVIYSDSPFAMKRESDSTVWVSATSGGYYYTMSTLGTTYNTSIYGTAIFTTSTLGFYYAEILYSNADIYLKKNLVNSEYYSDQYFYNYSSGGGGDGTYTTWEQLAIDEGLGNCLPLTEYYKVKKYKYINVLKDKTPYDGTHYRYFVLCSNKDPELTYREYEWETTTEIMDIKSEYWFQIDWDTLYSRYAVSMYKDPRFNDDGTRYMYANSWFNGLQKVIYSNWDMEGHWNNSGTWGEWNYSYEYHDDIKSNNEWEVMQKTGTKDTYILQWNYNQADANAGYWEAFEEIEIIALSEVNGVSKTYSIITIENYKEKDIIDRYYEFDLSDLAKTLAKKCWFDSGEEYVYPTAIYVRPIYIELPSNKVYYDDTDKVVLTISDGKIIRSKIEKVNITIDDNGNITSDTVINEDDTTYIEDIPTGNNYTENDGVDAVNEIDTMADALAEATEAMKTTANWLYQLPGLLGALFVFLPVQINYILKIGIVVTIVLRIAGR